MNTNKYIKKIVVIIILTSIPFIALIYTKPTIGLGWVLGALASCVNFLFMAKSASKVLGLTEKGSKIKTIKGFYLRYVFVLIYAVLVVKILNVDIISFGLGLLASQIAIYIEFILKSLTSGDWISYFRR